MIVTEWEQLEGKTIKRVEQFFLGGYLLVFEDGDYAHVDGDGEEQHGGHWPILCEDDQDFVKGAVKSMQRRKQVKEATGFDLLDQLVEIYYPEEVCSGDPT